MMKVGLSSFLVALLGVIAPFFLGWGVSYLFFPQKELLVHIFIGATLCATSVGITARVLKDLGKIDRPESKIILGAAVIDDVMGLVVLAIVQGMIVAADTGAGEIEPLYIGWIILKAIIFLVGAIIIGMFLSPRLFKIASRLRVHGMLLTVSLCVCFFLAYIAHMIDLAPIVGAFAAGLILEEVHYKDFIDKGEHQLKDLLHPIASFLVPIFFVRMGIKVDVKTFFNLDILGFAVFLTIAAIIGKQVCSFGVVQKGLNKLSVGIGMIPRGEVGLIFANIGAGMILHGKKVIDINTFSAVVIMVVVTTMITPPVLKLSLERDKK
jgi:Kef-type K+ transport system membrane component KefB